MERDEVIAKDEIEAVFDVVWEMYPSKTQKKEAFKHFRASVKTQGDLEEILLALMHYKQSVRVAKGFIQHGSTWFNNWKDWVNPSPPLMPRGWNPLGEESKGSTSYEKMKKRFSDDSW